MINQKLRAVKLNPPQELLIGLLEHYQNARFRDAESLAQKIIQDFPKHQFAWKILAAVFKATGRKSKAVDASEKAVELFPQDAEAHSHLGVMLKEVGRLDDAKGSFTKAVSLKPNYVEAHYNLGLTLRELKKLEEAEESFKQAVALMPNFAEAHNNLGITFQELGKLQEAEVTFNQAIMLNPDYAEAHNNLGNLLQEQKRFNEAVASYNQAISLKPNYAEAHSNLGVALQELGRFDESVSSYKKAIACKPDFAEAYSRLGLVSFIKGDAGASLENLERANKINTNLPDNKTALAILRARVTSEKTETSLENSRNQTNGSQQCKDPIILDRPVEKELITNLYEIKSIELEKFDNCRRSDPRFGDGKCSQDFELFANKSPIIRSLAHDLTFIMNEAVNSDVYISESFFNIFGAGGGTTPHTHLGKLDQNKHLNFGKQKYSLVYYVSVGDQNCKDPGILKLYDPAVDILPTEGMIAIFPAARRHSSIYGGRPDRIMIGANFYTL